MAGTPKSRFPSSYPLAMICFGLMLGLSAWLGYGVLQAFVRADPMYLAEHAIEAEATVLGLRTEKVLRGAHSEFPRGDVVNHVRYSFLDEDGRSHETEGTVSALLFAELKVGDTNSAYYLQGAPEASSFGAPGSIRNEPQRGSIILGVILAGGAFLAAGFFLNRAIFLRRGYGLL